MKKINLGTYREKDFDSKQDMLNQIEKDVVARATGRGEQTTEEKLIEEFKEKFEHGYGEPGVDMYNWIKSAFKQVREEAVRESHWKRCRLFGCVYGIEFVDKEPKDHCIYCGEPNTLLDGFYLDPSPIKALQKAINKELLKSKGNK